MADCRDAGLPEPEFRQSGPHFVTTIWRDWLTDAVLAKIGLNERQKVGMNIIRREGRLTSGLYQEETGTSRQTASRDLEELVEYKILERHGERKATFYTKVRSMPQI